jgi:hypothetical protein
MQRKPKMEIIIKVGLAATLSRDECADLKYDPATLSYQ